MTLENLEGRSPRQPRESLLAAAQAAEMELIDAYLEHLRRAGATTATLDLRRGILLRLNDHLDYGLGQASEEELAVWLYRDGWTQNTKATYYRGLKSFYMWASDPRDQWLSFNPMADLPAVCTARGVARPISDEQLRRILTEADEPFRTWATIAAYQGLRCIEISRLDREHVTESQLFVVKGKGGRPRVHDTDADVWRVLKDLPPGAVARVPGSGERASAAYVSIYSALYFRRQMGMPGVALHRMRHWLGVNIQRRYKDVRVTQSVLGHLSLSSTQIYTDASDEQQRAARATLPRLAE